MCSDNPDISKRRLLKSFVIASVAAGAIWPFSQSGATLTPARRGWRFCNKCHVLFYAEARTQSCAAGGSHAAQGYEFELDLNAPETSTVQTNWRGCTKCQAMFFNGYSSKGRCPAGGAHVADTAARYALTHDVAETRTMQKNWRLCNRCNAMFFDGYSAKGRCPAGEGHVAQGYNFVLRHFV